MKQLKSFSHDLYQLFTQNITVREIAEPLASFDDEKTAHSVLQFMAEKDFDHIGVRRDGIVVGYAVKTDLKAGKLRDHLAPFQSDDVIPVGAPLLDALEALKPPAIPELTPRVFVTTWDKVGGIVTFGDLQKAPVRMWLFGLISLLEMQMLRIIRAHYPDDSWLGLVPKRRLNRARDILLDRKTRNEAVDLADCLQFCDKRDLILTSATLQRRLELDQLADPKCFFEDLEDLRNDLAHAQNILASRRDSLLPLARQTTELLEKWEDIRIGAEGVLAH
jgi:hypothetical protein